MTLSLYCELLTTVSYPEGLWKRYNEFYFKVDFLLNSCQPKKKLKKFWNWTGSNNQIADTLKKKKKHRATLKCTSGSTQTPYIVTLRPISDGKWHCSNKTQGALLLRWSCESVWIHRKFILKVYRTKFHKETAQQFMVLRSRILPSNWKVTTEVILFSSVSTLAYHNQKN